MQAPIWQEWVWGTHLIVQVRVVSPLDNFSYVIVDPAQRAWLIDPYDLTTWEYSVARGWAVTGIVNTHAHLDHIRGNAAVLAAHDSPLTVAAHPQAEVPGQNVDLADGMLWGPFQVQAIPGHSMYDLGYRLASEMPNCPGAFFSGDVLFHGGVGNCHGGGDVDVLYDTITTRLILFPPDMALFPGHDYAAKNLAFGAYIEPDNPEILAYQQQPPAIWTWADMHKTNVFLRMHEPAIRNRLPLLDGKGPAVDARNVFRRLRALRDQW